MRRNVRRRVSNTSKDRLYTIFAFFIVAPIISIVLAIVLVQNVILPRLEEGQNAISTIEDNLDKKGMNNLDSNIDSNSAGDKDMSGLEPVDETDQKPESNDENTIETTFYSVQIGNFSSTANAETFIKELKEKNINDGYIVNVGESYKVFAGEFQAKEEAYSYLENIKKLYEDAFVNSVSSKDKITKP
ncbi:SPOR domain-containing protein [Proteiniborus sp. MB09-C3]|uniref:SPOR domain-containing protein n=1 Tax=Proteiniborus sp. MB09-C3 TaxID=3050072 RepID=UPI00255721C9|nr:SPOR domain-containing protein [Proteiniborus sp. MB09-C3]WIV10567.1 SPOR domain-containing protein [Proteiniborus sp. MB09-C3]